MSERVWCEHMTDGWLDNCKDCRLERLEAEVARLRREVNDQSHRHQQAMNKELLQHRDAERKRNCAVNTLRAVAELPEKWRFEGDSGYMDEWGAALDTARKGCADELEAKLKETR